MNKLQLTKEVASRIGVPHTEAQRVINAAIEIIEEALKAGSAVNLSGFGKFVVLGYGPKIGRNPRTGVVIPVPPHMKPKFVPSKKLVQHLQPTGE